MKQLLILLSAICLTTIAMMQTVAGQQTGEIHKAVTAGDLNKVRSLIEADSTLLESKDNSGYTPLSLACLRNQVVVANFLISKGANVNSRNNWDQTPLHNANGVFGQDFDLIKRLITLGADINAQGNRGDTPLEWAAARGNLKVARLLIENGADLNGFSKNSGTILHNTIGLNNIEMATLLIESGAKLNQKDPSGYTEIHLAAFQGASDLVSILIEHGVDVNTLDKYNHTALYYASKYGYRNVANVLIAGGAKESSISEINYGKAPQLSGAFKKEEAYLWYLGSFAGDGYAVKTKGHLLLFDPPGIDESPEAGLINGHLNPSELAGQKITTLIAKPDWERYKLDVFDLAKWMTDINFVISFKPESKINSQIPIPNYQLAILNQSLLLGDLKVHTIPATQGGVGYLVEVDGLKIFYAGYHACNNVSQSENYRKQIDFLKSFGSIDIAILPVAGHLIDSSTYDSYLYFVDKLSPKAIYLMHGNYDYKEYSKCATILRVRNILVTYPEGVLAKGERFHFNSDQIQR
jgi:ankyrin repeat protein